MANINDKFSRVSTGQRPSSTTVSTNRSSGATTLVCDDLTGWTTDDAVHFVTYKLNSSGGIVSGSQTDFKGIVSGNTITSISVTGGTDNGNAVGDVVVALPTAAWSKDLADGLLASHNQDGSLKTDSVTTAAIQDGAVSSNKIDWATYTDWSTSVVLTGWSSIAAKEFSYMRIGNIVFFYARVEGASNSTTTTMSLPVPVATANATTALVLNNGNWSAGSALISSTNNNVSFLTSTLVSLSATGTKGFRISGFYFA